MRSIHVKAFGCASIGFTLSCDKLTEVGTGLNKYSFNFWNAHPSPDRWDQLSRKSRNFKFSIMEKDIILKNSIEEIISNGVWTGEEVDITSVKIYNLFKQHLEYEKRKI